MAGQAKQLQERPDSSENHTKDEKMLPSVRVTSVEYVRNAESYVQKRQTG